MERKIQSLEDHIKYLYDEFEAKECEIDNLKNTLNDVKDRCKRMSEAHDRDKEDIDDLKMINEEQRVKITCLRKRRNEILDRHENQVDEYEKEFKAKEEDIKHLQEISKRMKIDMEDLQQEIVDKDEKLKQKEEISLKLSNSSLFDELSNAQSENRKTQLEAKIEILEKKVKNAEIQKMKRTNMMSKLKSLHDQNQESLLELQKKVEILSKTKPMEKCSFGSNCWRKF